MVIMGLGIINDGVETSMEFDVECRMSTIIVGAGWVNETAARRVNERPLCGGSTRPLRGGSAEPLRGGSAEPLRGSGLTAKPLRGK